jgi:ankyrin repeat protein
VDVKNNAGETPLHVAAIYGSLPVVQYLVNHGADVKVKTKDNITPLHYAITKENKNIARYLVDKGADILIPGQGFFEGVYYGSAYYGDSRTPLELAKELKYTSSSDDESDDEEDESDEDEYEAEDESEDEFDLYQYLVYKLFERSSVMREIPEEIKKHFIKILLYVF